MLSSISMSWDEDFFKDLGGGEQDDDNEFLWFCFSLFLFRLLGDSVSSLPCTSYPT